MQVKIEVAKKIEEYEGRVNHLYLDSVGKVTAGVGYLIPSRNDMLSVTLYPSDHAVSCQPASLAEKQIEYDNIARQRVGYKASWYKSYTTLAMSDSDIDVLRDHHIDSFYQELTHIYQKAKGYPDDFDTLPQGVQLALFDMIFNLGASKIVNVFTRFDRALKVADWRVAALECDRPQVSTARNQYVRQLFLTTANGAHVLCSSV
jgi:GH24 family phage-related lysozyme (muramidase)